MNNFILNESHYYYCIFCEYSGSKNQLLAHLSLHTNGFAKYKDFKGLSVLVSDEFGTEHFAMALKVFPQLSLIQMHDSSTIVDNIIRPVRCVKHMGRPTVGSIFDDNYDNATHELRCAVVKIIMNANYYCGLCGFNYESGLPSIEMAAGHMKTCFFGSCS